MRVAPRRADNCGSFDPNFEAKQASPGTVQAKRSSVTGLVQRGT